jgi:hypothetical protein
MKTIKKQFQPGCGAPKNKPFITVALILLAILQLTGCQSHTINPYPEPLQKAGVEYSISSPTSTPANQRWWVSFNDDKLDLLINNALNAISISCGAWPGSIRPMHSPARPGSSPAPG